MPPVKKLFLLDGMALAYRAHFAFIRRPILTSKGVNTSALYGFTQTILDITNNQQPTHLAVAFDTEAPTQRHAEYGDYKATRESMPEDLSQALPHLRRMLEAFRIPVLTYDGYEADDIIGTLVRRAEKAGFQSYMVTSDKDFGQLVDENTFVYKPSRMGEGVEILGLPEIQKRWAVQRPEQVVDVLALMGDTSDNIPGVPGIGEKTAIKLIGQYGGLEKLLAHTTELTGRVKESLETNREVALLSRKLATINCEVPFLIDLEALKVQAPDEDRLKGLMIEFEFNSIGRRLFGEDFKAGHGLPPATTASAAPPPATSSPRSVRPRAGTSAPRPADELMLISEPGAESSAPPTTTAAAQLKALTDVPHDYKLAGTPVQRAELVKALQAEESFCLDVQADNFDPKSARIVGIAFSLAPQSGYYVPISNDAADAMRILDEFRPVLESERIEKVGHNLKFDLSVLKRHGLEIRGKLFDTMVAHSLVEPEMRHSLSYLAEVYLGYTPLVLENFASPGQQGEFSISDLPVEMLSDHAVESADLAGQLRTNLERLLKEKRQERVFYEIESPLIPVLVDMECDGIKLDAVALGEFAAQLSKEIDQLEKTICRLAGKTFNLNSPRQLGQILFEDLKISDAPKRTKTGQYVTDEQTLAALAPDHEIVQRLLEYRTASKLKSTYADALPTAIWPKTGRVHTTFNQVVTATGRLNSQDPNLQNIPIRTERGQEIRKAFVPRAEGYGLLSADYSQIELRIIAALSHEAGLLEAFRTGIDVHTATAARVYGVFV